MSHLDNERENELEKTQKIDEYKKQIQDLKNTLKAQETKKDENIKQNIKEDNGKTTSAKSNNTNKKKLSSKKKTTIFLLVFLVVCIGITVFAIYYKKSNTKIPIVETIVEVIETEESKEEIIPDGLGIKSLLDTYDCNDLEIIDEEYHEGKEIIVNSDYSYWPIEINYIKIKGLKNKEIEDKINQEIKDKAFEILEEYKKYLEDSNVEAVFVNANCGANFSNILSVNLYTDIRLTDYDKHEEYPQKEAGLNYNLATGEKLEFKDLFTNTANIKNILTQSAYPDFAKDYTEGFDLSNVDYSEIEDRILRIVQYYNSGKPIDYIFSKLYISVIVDEDIFSIPMIDYYKDIAIFNRFANNSDLYDGSYKGKKNLFVLQNWNIENYYYAQIGEQADNFLTFINLGNFVWDTEDSSLPSSLINSEKEEQLLEMYKSEMNEKINECKDYLKSNPEKAIVLYVEAVANEETEYNSVTRESAKTGRVNLSVYIHKIYTNKEFYKSTLYETVLKNSFIAHMYAVAIDEVGFYIELSGEMLDKVNIEEEQVERYYDSQLTKYSTYEDIRYDFNLRKDIYTGERIFDAKTHEEIMPEEIIPEEEIPQQTIENVIGNVEAQNTIENTTIIENTVIEEAQNNTVNNETTENTSEVISNSLVNELENEEVGNTIENSAQNVENNI